MESKKKEEKPKKNLNFEGVTDNREAFFQESEKFQGEEVELTFRLDYNGDLNGKEFSDTFKGGQDFEYVKYKLSQVLGVNQEQLHLLHGGQPIIPVYSICDLNIKKDDVITVQIRAEDK